MKEVNEIDTELDRRINEILESGFNTPSIFKKILGKETAFAKDEKILGFVNVEKEYVNQVEKKEVYSNSKLVVATNFGIIIVEEGIDNDNLDFGGETGAVLTIHAFDKLLPGVGGWVVTFGIIFFAYSTILGWSYYGEKCCTYLLGEKYVLIYRLIYIASVFVGCVATLDLVWLFADTFNGLMAAPNCIALLLLSGIIAKESKDFIAKRKSGELY